MIRVGFCAGSVALAVLAGPAVSAEPEPPGTAFEALKSLVGTWRRADSANSPLRIQFSLTAGGTALTEAWTRDGQPHSLTVYHRDGDDLIATHYCPQGNQPRLVMTTQGAADTVRFAFHDASDLDSEDESHLFAMSFDLSDDQRLVRKETYRIGAQDEHSELVLVRAP